MYANEPLARPLTWWTRQQLDVLSVRMASHWAGWLQQWRVVPASVHGVECALAWEANVRDPAWAALGAGKNRCGWIDTSSWSAAVLFGTPLVGGNSGPVSRNVVARAYDALTEILCAQLGLEDGASASPAGVLFKPWSGAVVMSLRIGSESEVRVLLDAECVRRALGLTASPKKQRAALAPVQAAWMHQQVSATVRLPDCHLDLGTLASLRLGDVILFSHSLDQPLTVQVGDQPVCAAFLGRHGTTVAIELAPLVASEKS